LAERTGVLFVCLGNICRSPLAEGIFVDKAGRRGVLERFDVGSCGTGAWHAGERADPRSIAVARKYGIELTGVARALDPGRDLARYGLLVAMDRSNVRNLVRAGADPGRVKLMRSFDPTLTGRPESELEVPDPYEWEGDGFERVFKMLDAACEGLLGCLLDED
jgi:protein-tyrosine phosphatase